MATLSVATAALGLTLSPLASAPAQADDACNAPGTTYCFQITSADPQAASGAALDVENLTEDHPYLDMMPGKRPSSYWQLVPNQDSSFQIRNLDTNDCVDVWRTDSRLDQWECVGQSSQNWYVEPFTTGSTAYRIRQVDTGECMTLETGSVVKRPLPIKLVGQVKVEDCNTRPTQEWNLGISGTIPGLADLATQYAVGLCVKNAQTCDWKEDSTDYASYLGPSQCVSGLVHATKVPVTQTVDWTQTVGWENTVGGSVGVSIETGVSVGITAKITAQVSANYSHSWIGQSSVSNSVSFTLAPGDYGWVTREPLMKKVTGTWTFDVGGQPWTDTATIAIPAVDGTDNQLSVVTAHTEKEPPHDCGTGGPVSAS